MKKTKRLVIAVSMLLVSAVLLATASYAWFAMNTEVGVSGLEVEAYTDSLYLQISENESTGFGTSVLYDVNASGNSANLKLTTPKLANANIYTATPDSMAAAVVYYNADDDKVYYEAVTNKFGDVDYIYANDKLEKATDVSAYFTAAAFTLVTSNEKVTGDYYRYNNVTNEYEKETVTDASAKGLYKFNGETAASEKFAQPGTVYYNKSGDNYVEVKGIKLGTLISDTTKAYYFTVSASTVTSATASAANKYYVKNGNDYSYLGPIADDTVFAEYLFWGEAYSTDVNDEQAGNTLTIIPAADLDGYRLAKTVYLQMAEGSNHASNLKVSDVKIGGATNALSDAIRVLFVATSLADETAFATVTYDNGLGAFVGGDDLLLETILGNTDEVVKVEVYIYFDGTDEIADNASVAGAQLNGQSVEFKFSVEEFN